MRLFLWLFVSACVNVPAYDRGALAHPTMKTGDPAGVAEAHARAIQEGAVGGGFEVGGGCGCN
ncbi:MAG: DUF4266 domain-containing protein [Polyangiaceae bacterium]|nr:DUF4266 domain-containing protein [Polyangiaceae bacterium]